MMTYSLVVHTKIKSKIEEVERAPCVWPNDQTEHHHRLTFVRYYSVHVYEYIRTALAVTDDVDPLSDSLLLTNTKKSRAGRLLPFFLYKGIMVATVRTCVRTCILVLRCLVHSNGLFRERVIYVYVFIYSLPSQQFSSRLFHAIRRYLSVYVRESVHCSIPLYVPQREVGDEW